ncbi:MAG TPA: ScyD/ScyE family protein [Blastocatellia bacterium]|nr:ScyD/ScyE family protein [Blastocatellia bacterium]
MKNLITRLATFAALGLMFSSASVMAQTVVTGGLKGPIRAVVTKEGSLVVAETGTGQNDGRISIVDQNGNRRTLVDGLPSGISLGGGEPAPSGPSGLALRGRTLYVSIGEGDGVLPGPAGTQVPNPNRSSPIFSSVLEIRLDAPPDFSAGDFALTSDDHDGLSEGINLKARNPAGQRVIVSVLANFRDFAPEPRPGFPSNVRNSNPFGVALLKNTLYVVNAGLNLVHEVDISTGEHRVLARFAPKPNPLPFGPPFMDPVPDNVRVFGKQLLVPFLIGFPFPPGSSEVRKLNLANNSQTTFIGGLTSAIDVLPVRSNGQDQFFTLEFSTNMLANAPGRVRFFSSAGAAPVVIAEGLISPTSLSFDEATGTLFITEVFTGLIKKVQVGE